ncbi:glycine betaine ABC transporter substrate-binding protein [Desulfobacter postgatei]|uniref:glycine betaine ABC transporter substrate-binding protein n=1 Tax=Desulfobacter postgatei TaxID=2293 RepID=UPI00259B063A|nr:glycine betaine ABC transporter substrate-binding protein [uncultured Desulfobacter sp.]
MSVAKNICFVLITISMIMAAPAFASSDKPGEGITVKPARATWNTDYFQEAIVSRALTELGYTVDKPKDLKNPIFYKAVTLGDLDYWSNDCFPIHNSQLPKDF